MSGALHTVIGGVEYTIDQLDGVTGSSLGFKIAGLLAKQGKEIATGIASLSQSKKTGSEIEEEKAADFLITILGVLSQPGAADLFEELRTAFAARTTYDQNGRNFRLLETYGAHFQGRQASASRWFVACLKENFRDFLDIFQG